MAGVRAVRRALAALAACAALASPAAVAGAGPIDSLRFMAGSWAAGADADRQEEHWSAPRGGLMVGMHRDLRGGRARAFEFFRIEERDGSLWYMAQPGGRAATAFEAKHVSATRVVFENLAHDFPQRIVYWREKPGELRARAEGLVKGKLHGLEWTWTPGTLDH